MDDKMYNEFGEMHRKQERRTAEMNSTMRDSMIAEIRQSCPLPAMLEQLAEECVELAHAALKQARLIRGENPTDKDMADCVKMVTEELADVFTAVDVIGMQPDMNLIIAKTERWWRRMEPLRTQGPSPEEPDIPEPEINASWTEDDNE